MAGYLGGDFDSTQPDDGDSVRYGASWIRDLKGRLKTFCSVLFNLETGAVKDSVIRPESLRDSGVVPGTYTRVKVSSKGLVTEGSNPSEQQVAQYYRAVFSFGGTGGTGYIESESTVTPVTGTPGNYPGGAAAPFSNTSYSVSPGGSTNYSLFTFTPPAGVRRVKATLIGAGGAGYTTNASPYHFYGGGGGELVETIIPLDGLGTTAITIIVGGGTTADGCPSRVALSPTVFADAGSGKVATGSAGGGRVTGSGSSNVLGILRSSGTDGAYDAVGATGAPYVTVGVGGSGTSGVSGDGRVVLEWVK
jgi:hypothetical protein